MIIYQYQAHTFLFLELISQYYCKISVLFMVACVPFLIGCFQCLKLLSENRRWFKRCLPKRTCQPKPNMTSDLQGLRPLMQRWFLTSVIRARFVQCCCSGQKFQFKLMLHFGLRLWRKKEILSLQWSQTLAQEQLSCLANAAEQLAAYPACQAGLKVCITWSIMDCPVSNSMVSSHTNGNHIFKLVEQLLIGASWVPLSLPLPGFNYWLPGCYRVFFHIKFASPSSTCCCHCFKQFEPAGTKCTCN